MNRSKPANDRRNAKLMLVNFYLFFYSQSDLQADALCQILMWIADTIGSLLRSEISDVVEPGVWKFDPHAVVSSSYVYLCRLDSFHSTGRYHFNQISMTVVCICSGT